MDPKLPFIALPRFAQQRVRAQVPLAPVEGRAPFRWWMTGSLAVVMAALLPLRDFDSSRQNGVRVLRQSRFGTVETVLRIERAAAARGLPVLARIGGERPLIVLASSAGGTPVVMATADSEPALPLGLVVRANGGGAEVLVSAIAAAGWREALTAPEVAALPEVLREALG